MSLSISRIVSSRQAVTIQKLKPGEFFLRGYHSVQGVISGVENYSIYMKFTKSTINRHLVSNAGDIRRIEALGNDCCAANISKGFVTAIPADEELHRVEISLDVRVF